MLNKESEEHEQSKQVQEIKEQEILNCLWSESQELYISYRNGNNESFIKLLELCQNNLNDYVCYGFLLLLFNRSPKLQNHEKYHQIESHLIELLSKLPNDSTYIMNLTNEYQLFIFSFFYEQGIYFEKNYEEACRLCQLSANQSNVLAECSFGYFCSQDYLGVQQKELSFQYYSKSAKHGYSVAQSNLGWCYERGFGIEINLNEAFYWYEKAALQGNIDGQINLSRCYRYGIGIHKNYLLGFEWVKKAADKDDQIAQYVVGYCYHHGKGIEKNNEEAIKWFKLSADQGYSQAQYHLATNYLNSEDTLLHNEGNELLRKSADNGYSKAQYLLGFQYFSGTNSKVDEQKSMQLIELAANGNSVDAIALVGVSSYYGNISEKNIPKAIINLEKAATKGSIAAKYQLGLCYLQYHNSIDINNNINIDDDNDELLNFKKGFDIMYELNSNPDGRTFEVIYFLAICYQYGLGVTQDTTTSFTFYSRLSDYQYAPGQYALGRCYEEGEGTECNINEAIRLYKLSADQGYIDAIMKLNEYNCYDDNNEEDNKKIKIDNKLNYIFI